MKTLARTTNLLNIACGGKEFGRYQGRRRQDEKCRRNGLRLIAMAWETFGGTTPKTRITIRKITICHADKHNRPRG
jgi:hypothetical protein